MRAGSRSYLALEPQAKGMMPAVTTRSMRSDWLYCRTLDFMLGLMLRAMLSNGLPSNSVLPKCYCS